MRHLDPASLGDFADAFFGDGVLLGDDLVVKAQLRVADRPHPIASVEEVRKSLASAYDPCVSDVFEALDRALGVEPLGKSELVLDGSLEEVEKAKHHGDGVMVSLSLPREVAEALHVGGEDVEDMHVTLAYLGRLGRDVSSAQISELRSLVALFASQVAPMSGRIGGHGRFAASETSDGMDVFYASVDVPGLPRMRESLVRAIAPVAASSDKHGFTPHVTLAYVHPMEQSPSLSVPDLPVVFDRLSLTVGGVREDFVFGEQSIAKAEAAEAGPDTSWFDFVATVADQVEQAGSAAVSTADPSLDHLLVVAALGTMEFLVKADDEIIPNELLLSEHPDEPQSILALEVRPLLARLTPAQLALVHVASSLHAMWSPTTRAYEVSDGAPTTDLGNVALAALRESTGASSTDGTMDVLNQNLVEFAHDVAEKLNDGNRGDGLVVSCFDAGAAGDASEQAVLAARAAVPEIFLEAERA